MLPKCVLPSLRRKGRHDKPLPVDSLCNMWSDDKLGALWSLAKSRSANRNHPGGVSINNQTKVIDQAVSLGRSGMFGKACRVLQSSGIAPNNETTWHLLKSKHPSCPTPVAPASDSPLSPLSQISISFLSYVPSPRTLQLVLLVFESNTCLMWLVSHFPHPFAPPSGSWSISWQLERYPHLCLSSWLEAA